MAASYRDLLLRLKEQIRAAQVKAALAVNRELILLYWSIGREILAKQESEGWGAKIVERLAKDLPWPNLEIVQQPVAQLP